MFSVLGEQHQKDPANYKDKNPHPKAVLVNIKPVFDRLSTNELLERCLDGYTQNAPERAPWSFVEYLSKGNICWIKTFEHISFTGSVHIL